MRRNSGIWRRSKAKIPAVGRIKMPYRGNRLGIAQSPTVCLSAQNKTKLMKTLADLFAEGERFGRYSLTENGTLYPTVICNTQQDSLSMFVYFKQFSDEADKKDFIHLARMFTVVNRATAAMIALEMWFTRRSPDDPDSFEPPSEAVDRVEGVLLAGQDGTQKKSKILPIVRINQGNFFNFGDWPDGELEMGGGWITGDLLCPWPPSEFEIAFARKLLEVRGVRFVIDRG